MYPDSELDEGQRSKEDSQQRTIEAENNALFYMLTKLHRKDSFQIAHFP